LALRRGLQGATAGSLDGLEGLDLLHLSRARPPDIPAIIFTGTDLNESSIEDCLAHEADAVVRKMGSLDALSSAILPHFDRRQAQPRRAAREPMLCTMR